MSELVVELVRASLVAVVVAALAIVGRRLRALLRLEGRVDRLEEDTNEYVRSPQLATVIGGIQGEGREQSRRVDEILERCRVCDERTRTAVEDIARLEGARDGQGTSNRRR